MTKQELEEKIKNKESVWVVDFFGKGIYKVVLTNDYYISCGYLYFYERLLSNISLVFSTKAQAQHYLDCGNVTRTEKLPYITWEEVQYQHKGHGKNYYTIEFNSLNQIGSEKKSGIEINWRENLIIVFKDDSWNGVARFYEITEENFYKAYKVAKDLFLGGKNE